MNIRDFKHITKERIVWVDKHNRVVREPSNTSDYLITNIRIDYEQKCIIATIEHLATLII